MHRPKRKIMPTFKAQQLKDDVSQSGQKQQIKHNRTKSGPATLVMVNKATELSLVNKTGKRKSTPIIGSKDKKHKRKQSEEDANNNATVMRLDLNKTGQKSGKKTVKSVEKPKRGRSRTKSDNHVNHVDQSE